MISKNIFNIFLAQILGKLQIYHQIQRGTIKNSGINSGWPPKIVHNIQPDCLPFIWDFQNYISCFPSSKTKKDITKIETGGFDNLPPKTACYVKTLYTLNSYCCKLSKMVFNFFVSSKSKEIWEFKNLAVTYWNYRNRRFQTASIAKLAINSGEIVSMRKYSE